MFHRKEHHFYYHNGISKNCLIIELINNYNKSHYSYVSVWRVPEWKVAVQFFTFTSRNSLTFHWTDVMNTSMELILPKREDYFICYQYREYMGFQVLRIRLPYICRVLCWTDSKDRPNHWLSVLDFRLSPWNEYWFLVLGILHGVQDKFPDDASEVVVRPIFNGQELGFFRSNSWPLKMGPTAAAETSLGNLSCTPCQIPKIKNQWLSD